MFNSVGVAFLNAPIADIQKSYKIEGGKAV